MKIEKSYGLTPTEKFLSNLCENTFLKVWSYPNLYKKKADELCDLLAVFENHIFIFQDKNIFIELAWERWSRRAIEEQIKQLSRAKNWIINNPDRIFFDAKCTQTFPIKIPSESELDTFHDFKEYLVTKEDAIKQLQYLAYHGEENLLGYYFTNFDQQKNKYSIGVKDQKADSILIADDKLWQSFVNSAPYSRRKEANKKSYLWDKFIQTTCQNVLDGISLGNGNIFNGKSAIYEMAKEPRFTRRALSDHMLNAMKEFPDSDELAHHISFMPSFYPNKAYIFLQIHQPNIVNYDDYRSIRQHMLIIACGAAKNKYPHLNKIIGVAIDAPKFNMKNSEDFVLLDCEKWSQEQNLFYEEENKLFGFLNHNKSKQQIKTINDFPVE